jgi:hypothetical protein
MRRPWGPVTTAGAFILSAACNLFVGDYSVGDAGTTTGGGTVIVGATGCKTNSALDCAGGGAGFSCAAGDNPEVGDSTLSCSTPRVDGVNDDFCCVSFTSSASICVADDELTTACADPDSYGYQCAAADDSPTSIDASLKCTVGVPDPDGTSTDFCCTVQ